ncbi:unnamed protein product [Linum trigynum]|uniref:RNase H type-1 domain-containing protein n=1 Tax=Linum trigynum TaxID=586398 RepID=A0AAV2ESE6_9ROSI
MVHDILATGKNIEGRKREAYAECPFCHLDETQNHIFQECQWAIRVWRPSDFRPLFELEPNQSMGSWLCEIMEKVDNDSLGQLGMILWAMWNERNNQLFNKKKAEEWEIVLRATNYWEEFNQLQGKAIEGKEKEPRTWIRPPEGWMKVNVDAAVLEGGIRMGAVARDSHGKFVMAPVGRERRPWPPKLAELRAIEFGLQMVEENFGAVVVESDCMNAILKLKKMGSSRLEEGVRVREIQEKANQTGPVTWSFGRREGNQAAHFMVHLRWNWDKTEKWVGRSLICLLNCLDSDALAH